MYINLSGLHVLLTGATHSIGQVIATKLGEAGATLGLQYHKKNTKAEDLAYALGNSSRTFQADLSNKEQLVKFTNTIFAEFSDIEIIVNNLSHYTPTPFSLNHKDWFEAWQKNITLNLEATAYLTKEAIEHWRKRKTAGRIINIRKPLPHTSDEGTELAYISTKAATEAFFHNLSKSILPDKIRIFTLILPNLRSEEHKRFSKDPKDPQTITLPKPKDIAPMVVFLCSGLADPASGTTINMSAAQTQLAHAQTLNT